MFRLFKPKNGATPAEPEIRAVIDVRGITKTYKMGEVEVNALRGVDLAIYEGEFVSIMGPSGSGKSTLMNILGALDQPTRRLPARRRQRRQAERVRACPRAQQEDRLRLSELQPAQAHQRAASGRAAADLRGRGQPQQARQGRAGSRRQGNRLDHLPSELSGGQQQRVAIARALVNEPAMILADEPTGNLDSRSGTEVMQIFQTLNREQGITVIFVTHDPWIARHTNRVIMLRDGKIVADRAVKEPLIAGETERPSLADEMESILQDVYYGGDNEEYN
ncbi:MAG: ABC transporter ATP-binding protein [Anaerolineae bacterium]